MEGGKDNGCFVIGDYHDCLSDCCLKKQFTSFLHSSYT